MQRRDFLRTGAAAALTTNLVSHGSGARAAETANACRTYASPREAIASPRETEMFVTALRVGVSDTQPDYLAVVDVDPKSTSYARVVHRVMMPNVGDELHHFGWNA